MFADEETTFLYFILWLSPPRATCPLRLCVCVWDVHVCVWCVCVWDVHVCVVCMGVCVFLLLHDIYLITLVTSYFTDYMF